jgi:methionine synthase II (cobalamin-independent)
MNIISGRKVVTTAGTKVQLSETHRPVSKIIIIAETDNTNEVVVGDVNVVASLATRVGIPLKPVATGESTTVLYDVDLFDIWLDAVTNGEGVTYTYLY